MAHSSSGLGHRPLKAEITGSNPVCATIGFNTANFVPQRQERGVVAFYGTVHRSRHAVAGFALPRRTSISFTKDLMKDRVSVSSLVLRYFLMSLARVGTVVILSNVSRLCFRLLLASPSPGVSPNVLRHRRSRSWIFLSLPKSSTTYVLRPLIPSEWL